MKKGIMVVLSIFVLSFGALFLFMRFSGMGGNTPNGAMGGIGNGPENMENEESLFNTPLPIPPLLEDTNPDPKKAEFYLTAQESEKEFIKDKKTKTLGYNGDYLGPVIRVKNGEEVSVKVENDMSVGTTVHWHGLEVDGDQDGGPHSGILPGETWNPNFTISQPAATLWYHPHLLHTTGEQVYMGLAGLFYIDDEVSENLNIPKEYGVDDIPLVIQDKQFNSGGKYEYNLGMHDVMMGLQGERILVNGAINPYLEVPRGKVRLRLLNGSNARIYEFKFSSAQSFQQIASDGGFLEQPAEMNSLILSSAERAEIIVDFSNYNEGDVVHLTDQGSEFMKFVVNANEGKGYAVPDQITDIPEINPGNAIRTREFVMQGMGRNVNINGKQMDMNQIDEEVNLGDTEIWEISNDGSSMGGMMGGNGGIAHPFHAHGVQFQIIDRDGNPPPPNERGWKDTILVYPGEKVRAIATFDHEGIFMYHCHILEHEDAGMMGQFEVKDRL
ncbi:multicopper oxidase domain-containing protein [Cytobacillus sp. FSL W8-0315]|uniref:multicopper oxidase family protein n=1 Tax=Cytobacillus TaxID=2675230 RepID=UPI000311CB2D|nr:multicopper oxidase domain-containing protein [Cytobacillus pseudoceanisediminis]UQX57148.1 multicopper oxidase domain-containing protein [Cytobacillus pseudoceanisediminis]